MRLANYTVGKTGEQSFTPLGPEGIGRLGADDFDDVVWSLDIFDRCNSRHFLISWDLFWSRTRNRYFIWNPRDLSTKRLFPRRGLIMQPRVAAQPPPWVRFMMNSHP
jgi:hypothetical protein